MCVIPALHQARDKLQRKSSIYKLLHGFYHAFYEAVKPAVYYYPYNAFYQAIL